ncbi:Alpha/Beta hydrolase protein [Aspergillus crustosus]
MTTVCCEHMGLICGGLSRIVRKKVLAVPRCCQKRKGTQDRWRVNAIVDQRIDGSERLKSAKEFAEYCQIKESSIGGRRLSTKHEGYHIGRGYSLVGRANPPISLSYIVDLVIQSNPQLKRRIYDKDFFKDCPRLTSANLSLTMASTSHYHKTPNGTTIHYTQTGNLNGRLIVLLHGLGGSTATFTPLLPHLHPETNRLVSVDLEGLGETPLSMSDVILSITRYADDLESLVTSLQESENAQPLFLIGHSLGGIISTHYAARHPETISGLALLGTGRSIAHIPAACERMLSLATKTRTEGIQAAAEAAAVSNFPPSDEIDPALRTAVREAVGKSDVEGYAKACEAVASLDHLDPVYSQITAPTLLIAGSGDVISPPERSVGIKELIGDNAWVEVLEGVGHQFILQDLDGCVTAFKTLFERVEGA